MTNNESHLGSRYSPSSFACVIAIFYGELVASLCAPADHSSIHGACHTRVRIRILIRMHRVNLNSRTPFHEANGFGTLYLCPASHLQVAPPQRSFDFPMLAIFLYIFSSCRRSLTPFVVVHPLLYPTLSLVLCLLSAPFCPLPIFGLAARLEIYRSLILFCPLPLSSVCDGAAGYTALFFVGFLTSERKLVLSCSGLLSSFGLRRY